MNYTLESIIGPLGKYGVMAVEATSMDAPPLEGNSFVGEFSFQGPLVLKIELGQDADSPEITIPLQDLIYGSDGNDLNFDCPGHQIAFYRFVAEEIKKIGEDLAGLADAIEAQCCGE